VDFNSLVIKVLTFSPALEFPPTTMFHRMFPFCAFLSSSPRGLPFFPTLGRPDPPHSSFFPAPLLFFFFRHPPRPLVSPPLLPCNFHVLKPHSRLSHLPLKQVSRAPSYFRPRPPALPPISYEQKVQVEYPDSIVPFLVEYRTSPHSFMDLYQIDGKPGF